MVSRRKFLCFSAALSMSGLGAGCSNFVPEGASAPAQLSQGLIVEKIDLTRRANGRAPLAYSLSLEKAARRQAELMAKKDTLSHDLGSSLRERVDAAGYVGAVGEIIAAGHKTLESAIAGWLESPRHRTILLSANFESFGLGVARAANPDSRYKTYWAMVLGGDADLWMRTPS